MQYRADQQCGVNQQYKTDRQSKTDRQLSLNQQHRNQQYKKQQYQINQPHKSAHIGVRVSAQKVFATLFWLISIFALLSLFANALGELLPEPYKTLFVAPLSVDSESSVPTLYSVLRLQVCAILIFAISYFVKINQRKFLRHWQALSLIFWALSLDEAASIHERIVDPMRAIIGSQDGFLYYSWVVPAAALVVIVLLSYLTFLAALPKKIRYLFLTAGGLFVMGALGLEMISGKVLNMGAPEMAYVFVFTGEEFLEMLGVIVFLYALLSYLQSFINSVEISLSK